MPDRLDPNVAVDPHSFQLSYEGALELDGDQRWLDACYVLLLSGRLGLRPGELQHLHEGWLNWERGELHVPAHDPCACQHCWERARVAQRAGDGRPLAAIVAADCWSPPTATGRTIAFGWSDRLTAILARAIETSMPFDRPVPGMTALVREAAERAGVEPDGFSMLALRSAAARFVAEAGFTAWRIAELLDVDRETAGAFVERWGRQTGDSAGAPAFSGEGADYVLTRTPDSLAREPVDPSAYDSEWRSTRAAERDERPAGSPRPSAVPDEVTYDPPAHSHPGYLTQWRTTDDSGPMSLHEWAGRSGDASTASADPAEPQSAPVPDGTERVDPTSAITEPIVRKVSTRFACEGIRDGDLSGGNVLLGQEELVIVTHGDGDNLDHELIPIHEVTNVVPEYCPSALEDELDRTLAIAYRVDGESRAAIIELPDGDSGTILTDLLSRRLSQVPAAVTHPERVDGGATGESTEPAAVDVDPARIAITPDHAENPTVTIRLDDLIHADRETQVLDGDTYRGLHLKHLRPSGETVTTVLATLEETARDLLDTFVMHQYGSQKDSVASVTLEEAHRDTLAALYTADPSDDLASVLDREPDELRATIAALETGGLVRSTERGIRLTGPGHMLLDDEVEDVGL